MPVKQGAKFTRFYCPALGVELSGGAIVAFDKDYITVSEINSTTQFIIPRITPYLIEIALKVLPTRRFFG